MPNPTNQQPKSTASGLSLGIKGQPTTLPIVDVQGKLPKWAKYENNLNNIYSKSDMIGQYLTPMARALGNSEANYPERIDKDYDKIKNDYIARALIIDRNNDKYTNKEREIINNSSFRGKDKKYAYNNPVKLPIGSGDAATDFLYDNDYLTKVPGIRQILQHVAKKQVGSGDPNTQNFLDDSNNGLTPAKYVPKNDYFQFLPSYTLKDSYGVRQDSKFLQQYANKKTIDSIKKNPIYISDADKEGGAEQMYEQNPDLAKYKKGLAWDKEKNLPYYFVADAWDFDPSTYSNEWKEGNKKEDRKTYQESTLLNKVGNPYKVYDRFYFEPETGKYIDDTKDSRFKNGSLPFMNSGATKNNIRSNNLPEKFDAVKNKKVLDWTNQYVNSLKYKERLTPFYKYPDYIQKQRAGLIGSLTVRNNPGTASSYYPNGNEIALSPLQAKAAGASTDEILAHEAAHAVNGNDRIKGAQLSPQETDFILRRNRNLTPQDISRFSALAKESGKPIQDILKDNNHDVNPSENHSDINALRYLMNKRGLYDASKQDIDPATLKKAAQDPAINRSFIWKRLKDSFDDKALIEIMNKIAVNKNNNQSNTV